MDIGGLDAGPRAGAKLTIEIAAMIPPRDVEPLDNWVAEGVAQLGERLCELGAAEQTVTRRHVINQLTATLGSGWELGPERAATQERQAKLLSSATFYGPTILRRHEATGHTASLIEVGWAVGRNNLSPLLLDVFGVLEAYQQPGFVAGYLVAAAPRRRWSRQERDLCTDWFAPEPGDVTHIDLANYVMFHPHGWRNLRHEIDRRLETLPGLIELQTIATAPFRMRERAGGMKRCSVRCARVTPSPTN